MSIRKNSILSPKRYSAVTHGQFVVGPRGMYFKFDHCLDPTLVYGAMQRVELSSYLAENFDYILCEYEHDLWEARRILPRIAENIMYFDDYYEKYPYLEKRTLMVPYGGVREYLDVTTATVDYRR